MSNAAKGASFEALVGRALSDEWGCMLKSPFVVEVGHPSKSHRFDLGSIERQVIVECKHFTWTSGGNVPSAKITTLREAVFHLRLAQGSWSRRLAVYRSLHPSTGESLGEYFVRLNRYLLGNVSVLEIDDRGRVLTLVENGGLFDEHLSARE